MRIQYLHISAYLCERCRGPVISGSTPVRENEISKETGGQAGWSDLPLLWPQTKQKRLGLAAHATFTSSMGRRERYRHRPSGQRVL